MTEAVGNVIGADSKKWEGEKLESCDHLNPTKGKQQIQ